MNPTARKWSQLLIPLVLLAFLVGIWFLKQSRTQQPAEPGPEASASGSAQNGLDFSLALNAVPDFARYAEQTLPLVIDYGSDSCTACKMMKPILEKLNKEMEGRAFIKFVDTMKYPEAIDSAPIQLIPSQLFFNADGSPFQPSEELAALIEFTFLRDDSSGKPRFTLHQGGLSEGELRGILREMGVE